MPHDDASLSTAHPHVPVVDRRVRDRICQPPLTHIIGPDLAAVARDVLHPR